MFKGLVPGLARSLPSLSGLRFVGLRHPKPLNQQSFQTLWRSQRPFSGSIRRHKDLDPLKTTKSQLLADASSKLSRFWIHVKWPLTRNNRPFSIDDFSAFASWLVMGNVLWVVLGTTTFGLVTMYSIHTFDRFWNTISGDDENDEDVAPQAKDKSFLSYLAGSILSQGLGMRFMFEKGSVLPELADGMLKFRNLKVVSTEKDESLRFLAKIQELNITLSFKKWYDGNGLIEDMEVFGMHAKVYKKDESFPQIESSNSSNQPDTISSFAMSMSKYDSNNIQNDFHEHKLEELENIKSNQVAFMAPNYQLGHLRLHDSVVELHENQDTTPFKVTIFNCDLPRLRGDRLIVDFFNANNVTGAVNNSMFTIHKHQSFTDENVVRFKLDSIDMESISKANPQLKFNWIVNGKAEILADIRLPEMDKVKDDTGFLPSASTFQQLWNDLKTATSAPQESSEGEPNNNSLLKGAIAAIYETFTKNNDIDETRSRNDSEYVIVNVKVKFKNLKAAMPLHLPMASSTSLPFITLQKLRALIGYINSMEKENDSILIKTTVIEKLVDLYNLDNITKTRIFDAIVSDIYDDLLKMIKQDENRILEEKASTWSQTVASQLLLLGLGVLA